MTRSFALIPVLLLVACFNATGQSFTRSQQPEPLAKSRKLWYFSLAAVAAGNILDAHSSFGKRELNPFLATPSQRFGWQSTGIKFGMQLPILGFQFWKHRHNPSAAAYKTGAITNFALGATFGSVAIHNYQVPSGH